MYFRYALSDSPTGKRLRMLQDDHMLGIRAGIISEQIRLHPELLHREDPKFGTERWTWHLQVEELLKPAGQAFVIDLKPSARRAGSGASLYQLRDVWGWSEPGWTPIMLRIRGLVIDGEPRVADWKDFPYEVRDEWESIYTFLFLNGTIEAGKPVGRWTGTSPSPTNSALLFPHHLRHFTRCIRETTPELMS